MLEQPCPEHIEFTLVPARNDVEPEPAAADMIGCHHHLGGKHRIEKGNVNRAEDDDLVGCGKRAGRPGQRLVGRAFRIGLAAITMPPGDRQRELKPCCLRQLVGGERIVPARNPAFGDLCHR